MLTAWEAHKQIASLTNHKEHCLIIDDSVLEHSGAKRMENVTRTYDHNLGSTVKGFTCLQLGWTDGRSCFTIDSKLVASDENLKPVLNRRTSVLTIVFMVVLYVMMLTYQNLNF